MQGVTEGEGIGTGGTLLREPADAGAAAGDELASSLRPPAPPPAAGPGAGERRTPPRDADARTPDTRDEPAPPGARARQIEQALSGSPVMVFGMDADLRYAWLVNTHAPWSSDRLLGRTDEELIGSEAARPITEAKRRVLRTGVPETIEIDVEVERQRHWYEVAIQREGGGDGAGGAMGLLCTALDISEKKRREIMLQALLREVSHRSKNLLSMVLSIASQTSRKASDKQTFLARFTGRIQSIARSQDAITHSDWRGASLSELIESQVLALLPGRRGAVRREGPDLQLTPNGALHVGLALHELVTNALDYGALSLADGRVVVRVLPPSARGGVELVWHETRHAGAAERGDEPAGDRPSGAEPDRAARGEAGGTGAPRDGATGGSDIRESFGMVTLKRIVPAAVDGTARLEIGDGELTYRLEVGPGQCEVIQP